MSVSDEIKELNKQLYPTGRVWGYVQGAEQSEIIVTRFVDGLGNPFVDGFGNAFIQTLGTETSPSKRLVNAFLKSYTRYYEDVLSITDQILADNENFDETDASNWERNYGLARTGTLEERKANILRRQSYPAGVEERGHYLLIQDELQKAGFDVYLTENRFANGTGWTVTNPTESLSLPEQFGISEFGISEFGGDTTGNDFTILANYVDESLDSIYFDEIESIDSQFGVSQFGVSQFGIYEPRDISISLRSTFFVGGQSSGSIATVPSSRKNEFRHLLLKLKPCQCVAFMYVDYN